MRDVARSEWLLNAGTTDVRGVRLVSWQVSRRALYALADVINCSETGGVIFKVDPLLDDVWSVETTGGQVDARLNFSRVLSYAAGQCIRAHTVFGDVHF